MNYIIQSEKDLAKVLKERREALDLTQKDVANYSQLSHNGVSQIELGAKSVRLSTLLKLSKFLGFKIKIEMEE